MKVGNGLKVTDGTWRFHEGVAASFVDHVRRSVPLYEAGHELVADIGSCFVRPQGLGYELGAATGQLLRCLATSNVRNRSATWIGIDHESEMVARAREYCADLDNVRVVEGDISAIDYRPCDFVVAYLTLNFLDFAPRRRALKRIFGALREGGGLFLFDKVLAPDSLLQDLGAVLHYRFKREEGLTAEEILNKADSLAGVLQPMTAEQDVALLRGCGFRSVSTVLKYLCFEGFIAVK